MPLLGDDRFAQMKFALNDIKYTGALKEEFANNVTLLIALLP